MATLHYLTGQTRTLTISGTLTGTLRYKSVLLGAIDPGETSESWEAPRFHVRCPYNDWYVDATPTYSGGLFGLTVSCKGPAGIVSDDDVGMIISPTQPDPMSAGGWEEHDMSGTFEIGATMERVVEITTGSFDALAGRTWRKRRTYERVQEGSSATVTITCGGLTATASGTVGTGLGSELTLSSAYLPEQTCEITCQGGAGPHAVDMATDAAAEATMTFTGAGTAELSDTLDETWEQTRVYASGTGCLAHAESADAIQRRALVAWGAGPEKTADLGVVARRMEEAYAGTLTMLLTDRPGHESEIDVVGGAYSGTITQILDEAGGEQEKSGTGIHTPTGFANNQYGPVSLLAKTESLDALGEDTRDRGVLFRCDHWNSMSIVLPSSEMIDEGEYISPPGGYAGTWEAVTGCHMTQGGGSVQAVRDAPASTITWRRTITPLVYFNAYRFLRLRMRSNIADGQFTVRIGTKTWNADYQGVTLSVPASFQYRILDLCSPTSESDSTDGTDSQYETEGPYWGVGGPVTEIEFRGLNPTTYYNDTTELIRLNQTRGDCLPAYDVQYNGMQRCMAAQTDGKLSLDEPGSSSSEEYTILYLFQRLNDQIPALGRRNGGWNAVANAGITDPAEWGSWSQWLNNNRPAQWLYGGGAQYRASAWTYGLWLNWESPSTIYGQLLADEVDWLPGGGDEYGIAGGGSTGPLTLRAAYICRGAGWGIVLDEDGLPPSVPETVDAVDVTAGGSAGDAVITGTYGEYATSTPYGHGEHTIRVRCRSISLDREWHNRYRRRVCLRIPGTGTPYRCCEVDSPRGWLHIGEGKRIATYHAANGELLMLSGEHEVEYWERLRYDPRRGHLYCAGPWGDNYRVYRSQDGGLTVEEVLTVTVRSACVQHDSERGWVVVLWEDEADVMRQVSLDGGATWSVAAAISADGAALNDTRVLDMTQDPRSGRMWLCTIDASDVHVTWSSDDGGETWESVLT